MKTLAEIKVTYKEFDAVDGRKEACYKFRSKLDLQKDEVTANDLAMHIINLERRSRNVDAVWDRFKAFVLSKGGDPESRNFCTTNEILSMFEVGHGTLFRISERYRFKAAYYGYWPKKTSEKVLEKYRLFKAGGAPLSEYIPEEDAAFALDIEEGLLAELLGKYSVDRNGGILRKDFEKLAAEEFGEKFNQIFYRLGHSFNQVRKMRRACGPKIIPSTDEGTGKLRYMYNASYGEGDLTKLGLGERTARVLSHSKIFKHRRPFGVEIARELYSRGLRHELPGLNYPRGLADSNHEILLHEERIERESGKRTINSNVYSSF